MVAKTIRSGIANNPKSAAATMWSRHGSGPSVKAKA
jgi:hypothetical protein